MFYNNIAQYIFNKQPICIGIINIKKKYLNVYDYIT